MTLDAGMSSSARPLWLLDIDGVVNALSYAPVAAIWPRSQWLQRTITTPVEGRGILTLPILAAQAVLDFVTRVHEQGLAEIRWHSTWRDSAVTAFAPVMGLPTSIPISVAPEWSQRPHERWWKLGAAERALAEGRRLVWTDDDIPVYLGERSAVSPDGRSLLIGPEPAFGLTAPHLAQIEAFLIR
jgi:hypothetical protein